MVVHVIPTIVFLAIDSGLAAGVLALTINRRTGTASWIPFALSCAIVGVQAATIAGGPKLGFLPAAAIAVLLVLRASRPRTQESPRPGR